MSTFTHVVVGTNDLEKADAFYGPVLGALGLKNLGPQGDRGTIYGTEGAPSFMVMTPANGQPAAPANGATVGFAAPNRAAIHKFHEAGLANGGTCNGEPGPRSASEHAYAAYLRDPDGNKICTFCFAAE